VTPTTTNHVESIPAAKAVRESLCAALLQVQLLRDLLKVAERKERQQASTPDTRKVVRRG
jgi:hypothetical protein